MLRTPVFRILVSSASAAAFWKLRLGGDTQTFSDLVVFLPKEFDASGCWVIGARGG